MSKTAKKYETGKRVAEASDGRITLEVVDGIATLKGEFTRADRKPLRFKKGAGWRYRLVDGVETWSLNVSRLAEAASVESLKPAAKSTAKASAKSAGKSSRKSSRKASGKTSRKASAKSAAEPSAKTSDEASAVEVGTVYARVWGHDMTIVTFYEVTRSTSASVWLRKIGSVEKGADKYGQHGTVTPVPHAFVGEEFRKAVGKGAERLSGGIAVWDGEPLRFNYMD